MRDFKLKLIESNQEISDEDFTYKLDEKATTLDLKEAFTEEEGYNPDEVRLIYQRQEGDDEPLEDTELLEDIEKHPGVFLIECPPLAHKGNISVFCKMSEIGEGEKICLLVGSEKKFEHYKLSHEENKMRIPNCKSLLILCTLIWVKRIYLQ